MRARVSLEGTMAVAVLLFLVAPPLSAEVVFFVQPYGDAESEQYAAFQLAVGALAEQDFEDPLLGPELGALPALPIGNIELEMDAVLGDGTPVEPFLFSSPEFDAAGRFHGRSLFVGTRLTITAPPGLDLRALGTWVFDDFRLYDAAYLVDVTEIDGSVWQVALENDIGLNAYGHEIEGFVGAVSDIGIRQLTITAIDPVSGEALPDLLEIDHVVIPAATLPPSPGDEDEDDEDDDEDEDVEDDDDDCDEGHHDGDSHEDDDCQDGGDDDDRRGHRRHRRREHGGKGNNRARHHSHRRSHGSR